VVSASSAAVSKKTERFWLEVAIVKMSRWLGSLQIAVTLLTLFATVLIIGTIVESWYDGKVAQQLVYRTWWFTVLLAFLGVNIFFAAAKKWPWKKHQTGFLITHAGLLTLVAGGLLNSLGGTDAQMPLVDTEDYEYFPDYGPHSSNEMIDQDVSRIRVRQPHKDRNKVTEFDFEPGPFTWKADEYIQPQTDALAGVLKLIAHPLPRSWSVDLSGDARLEVLNSYPNCRIEPFGPARSPTTSSFPAIQFQMASSRVARPMQDNWVAYHNQGRVIEVGPAAVEMLGRDLSPELLEEFLKPPPQGQTGAKGQLVICLGGRKVRIDVAGRLNAGVEPLGDTGWTINILRYSSSENEQSGVPSRPSVGFEMNSPGQKPIRLGAMARRGGELLQDHSTSALRDIQVWYHPPDYRYGDQSLKGLLQFVTANDGRLYYRSFNSSKGAFKFETAGTTGKGEKRQPIWEGMNWSFQITDYIPKAEAGPYLIPVNRRLGMQDPRAAPALRCRLSAGKESKEFWVRKTDKGFTSVEVGGDVYEVGYNVYTRTLDFEITLLRAETTTDKGTGRPATYTSYVQLTDTGRKINGQPCVITMNEPLDHGGYKLYQSGLNPARMDEDGKPVNQSVFTVSKDPGLWLKYAGSTMLALGITCMFYMKAYFFKPRGRPDPARNGPPSPVATQGK
jgi:hypothetical protein